MSHAATSPRYFPFTDSFARRHIGPDPTEQAAMLQGLGFVNLEELSRRAVPPSIRLERPLNLPAALSEAEALNQLRGMAARNQVFRSFIGLGYYDTLTPPVIQRNILENPGWYTPYTPYQAEISQGRLEGLLNFQTMVGDLTGLEIANASLLDEATACAEAMMLCHRVKEGAAAGGPVPNRFLVADHCHPQNIDIVRTRAKALGLEVVVGDWKRFEFTPEVFGALVQYPATDGTVEAYAALAAAAKAAGALLAVATDLLALTLLQPPGEFGADVAVGSAQRFGVPLGYGGPHAAFLATRDAFKRQIPGRLVGVSKDSRGRPALRLSLGTREQHIRRDKATSNICTAQALLANMAMAYACYHGPDGLKAIAERVHALTGLLATGLGRLGLKVVNPTFFDTLTVEVAHSITVHRTAESRQINLRKVDSTHVGVSLDEVTTVLEVEQLLQIFQDGAALPFEVATLIPAAPVLPRRTSSYLQHAVFNRHHSETEMLRYLRQLEAKDLSLCHSMIPLGSCTMKLNATAEMLPVSWPEFARIHPYVPVGQTRGYQQLFEELEQWLAEITGFAGVSLQPNAGSQGEYAGLLVIRAWHESRGEGHRNICLIPTSAHGTNPASAVMAGLVVVAVACDKEGNIDLADLRVKIDQYRGQIACLMVTYPSTHGVFETAIQDLCALVHEAGGQVYMDGANLNAQVGLTSPAVTGADVCHLNLHKTFCIPHGGGGPGVGPIAVAEHLVPFLPGHAVVNLGGEEPIGAVSAAPWGSASICTISWMYLAMMGPDGLTTATQVAILNANYITRRLEPYFPTLYRAQGLVAHECILDLRPFKSVTAEDVAKRLMDYGFHAPTLSWPVAGTLMVEPTESEAKAELDRFCDAMIAIHAEIMAIESGQADAKNNLLKNAPHPVEVVVADRWDRPYSREQAAYPVPGLRDVKFWPAVGRVDNVFGDRNLVCSCVGMEAYQ